jgi:hypothetical protein
LERSGKQLALICLKHPLKVISDEGANPNIQRSEGFVSDCVKKHTDWSAAESSI